MVKYKFIKDGAYSVKVEDVETVNNFNAKVEKEKKYDSDGDEIDDEDDDNNDLLFQYDLDDNEPVELEEDIDYTDTAFILQNLKIGIPSMNDDRTYTLQSREIQANIISSQVRFYLYCCLDIFTKDPKNVTILIIGEGFIGTHIINELIEVGCKDMIRIYTRGDLSAEDWKLKGLKASSKISELFPNGLQPDIIILSIEYSNFNLICRRLLLNNLIHEATFIISCSFGFIRMKLCQALNTNNIFRVYVEPQDIIERLKHDTLSKLSTMLSTAHIYSEKIVISEAKLKLQQFYDSKLPLLEANIIQNINNNNNNINIPPRIITADTLSRPSTAIAKQFTPNRKGYHRSTIRQQPSATSPDQSSRPSTGQLSSDQSSRPSSSSPKILPEVLGHRASSRSPSVYNKQLGDNITNRSTLPTGRTQLYINTNITTHDNNHNNNTNTTINSNKNNDNNNNNITSTFNSFTNRNTPKVSTMDKSLSSSISLEPSIKSDGTDDHISLQQKQQEQQEQYINYDEFSTSIASSSLQKSYNDANSDNYIDNNNINNINNNNNNIEKNLRDEVMNDNDYIAASCLGARLIHVEGTIEHDWLMSMIDVCKFIISYIIIDCYSDNDVMVVIMQ